MDPQTAAESVLLTTEVVLFTIRDDRLVVLLVAGDGPWRLPGGPLGPGEELDQAARNRLAEQAGVHGVWLEQLYTLGAPGRDGAGSRRVAVAYYALVPPAGLPGALAAGLDWHPVAGLPALVLDHGEIVTRAHQRLAAKADYSTIALQFMPERFPLTRLQRVYEAILGAPLDKRNFRKRILSLGCLEDTGELAQPGKHRPARLYRVKDPARVEIIK